MKPRLPRRNLPDVCVRCATCMPCPPRIRVTPRFPGRSRRVPERRDSARLRRLPWTTGSNSAPLAASATPPALPGPHLRAESDGKGEVSGRAGKDLPGLAPRPERPLWRAGLPFFQDCQPLMKNHTIRWLLDRVLEIDRRRALPEYDSPTFRQWFSTRPATGEAAGRPRIAYFHGCFTNTNEVDVGKASVALLEAHGFTVLVPPALLGHPPPRGRRPRGAREMGLRNLSLLLPTVQEGTDIVFSSTSCGLMLRHEYGPLSISRALRNWRCASSISVSFSCISIRRGNRRCRSGLCR